MSRRSRASIVWATSCLGLAAACSGGSGSAGNGGGAGFCVA